MKKTACIVLPFTLVSVFYLNLLAQEPRQNITPEKKSETKPAEAAPTLFPYRPIGSWVGKRFIFLPKPKGAESGTYEDFSRAITHQKYAGRVARVVSANNSSASAYIEFEMEDDGEKLRVFTLANKESVKGMALVDDIENARKQWAGKTVWSKMLMISSYDEQSGAVTMTPVKKIGPLKVVNVVPGWDEEKPVRFKLETPDGKQGFVDLNLSGTNVQKEVRHLSHISYEIWHMAYPPLPVEKWPHIQYCSPAMAAKYCPTCQKTFASTERLCSDDGSVLSLNDPYHLVGRTLLDRYRIDALVGLGGMGAVYYAYHSGIDRHVAFKILQPNIALSDDHVVEMFEREAKLAGRLSHENIVDVKDAGRADDGLAYIVMEWLEGRTLDEELLRQGQFSFSRATGIARQIAAALGEAHRKHIVHRDLKPGNIMLIDSPRRRDHVKVLDFGIGKALGETMGGSMVSIVVGTPHYASPEQLTVGGRIDGRSDIYALGIIIYRMLGGKLPFNNHSMGEVIQMQLTGEPAPLCTLRPETPPAIERLVTSMLAKNPARRPQSAVEVLAALDQTLPYPEKDDVAPTGETTIQRGHNLAERATEEMHAAPPPRGTFSTNVQPATRVKTPAVYAMVIGAALVASSYGLYRYVSDGPASDVPERLVMITTPSTTVAEVRAPSQNSTAGAQSEPQTSPGEQAKESPAPANRSQQDNRQLAYKHFEKAQALFRQGRRRAALSECNKALKLNPQHKKARELQRQINVAIRILEPQ